MWLCGQYAPVDNMPLWTICPGGQYALVDNMTLWTICLGAQYAPVVNMPRWSIFPGGQNALWDKMLQRTTCSMAMLHYKVPCMMYMYILVLCAKKTKWPVTIINMQLFVATRTFVRVDSCYVVRIGTTQNNQRLFLEALASLGPGLSLTHWLIDSLTDLFILLLRSYKE